MRIEQQDSGAHDLPHAGGLLYRETHDKLGHLLGQRFHFRMTF